ncbi:uncharacterized protein LOC117246998 [Epinephelus lanceolatus]
MARPGRPASESYQPVCYSVTQSASYSSEVLVARAEDADDQAPIFSISKSSMDVVMATGPPHKRDPAWTCMDLRRSSSTNTHSEQNSVMMQQLHPRMWQCLNTNNTHQMSVEAQNVDMHSPPALSERWITNMHRWSACSSSTHSRSSTPDTVVWKSGTSCPSSLTQDTPCSSMSKPTSPQATSSSFISPLTTPPLPPEDLLTSSSTLTLSTHQQEDLLVSSPAPSPLPSPLPAHTSSPLPYNSPDLLRLTSAEDEGFLENNSLSFTFPSPIPSSVSLAGGGAPLDPGCLVDDVIEDLHSPGGTQLSDSGGMRSPVQMLNYLSPNSPAHSQESERGGSVCHLQLPGRSLPTGRDRRSPLVSSFSDSLLGDGCKCKLNAREGITKAQVFREEGTMTSQLDLVDAAVQTITPISSFWGLKKNMSNSNMGSHSLLGSPPGSRLNLKFSVGSHSNLVSPSSSMFPASSSEEEEEERQGDNPEWDINSAALRDLERKRSCLKSQGEDKGQMERRSSMKQVQWDEDGMTWDIHGASVDPEALTMAIQKHLELQNSPRPLRHSSKKKRAPKPPLISNVVKAMTPELHPPVMVITSTCMVEGEKEETSEVDKGQKEVEEEGAGKKEETVEAVRRISKAEGANAKEESEVYGEEGTRRPKSPSHGSGHSRKRSVIRSLRRPGWCGGSKKTDD